MPSPDKQLAPTGETSAACGAKRGSNQAFSVFAKRPVKILKNGAKILFVQGLAHEHFALGTGRFSWHK
jgi:hypothetical protein